MAALAINTERGGSALTGDQLHRLLDRLIADDPDALALARPLVGPRQRTTQEGGES